MDDQLLGIYLNDHLAGATGAEELAKRARASARGDLALFLERLTANIREDRETLLAVMQKTRTRRDHLKVLAGIAAERFGRLKLNGRLFEPSPLSRVTELEALALGVEGKRCLWLTLAELDDRRLEEFDFQALARRAQSQRRQLERWRRDAARRALA